MGRSGEALVTVTLSCLPALPALLAAPALPALPALSALVAQASFEETVRDLSSSDSDTRLRAALLLRDAADPEAALPLARAVVDTVDEVQLAAIAAELNIFLAEKLVPRKRVALVVEVRNQILAEPAFSAGPSALGSAPAPPEVLDALRVAARDDNPRVAIEALYAFGTLGDTPSGAARRELLTRSGADLAAHLGAADPAKRYAAARVMGRLFTRRTQDDPIDPSVGDAVITALNDSDRAVKSAAMRALGTMRYARGVQALTDLFTFYGKGDNAEAALDALAHIAHPTSMPLLVAQLVGRNAALRVIAIEGLARAGDPARLADIRTATDADRSDAMALAGAFASALLENGPVERIVDALTKPKLRDRARQYVAELAPRRAAVFGRHLLDPDERIRLDVVEALGLSGDRAALPLIEPLLQDRDPQVMRAAERATARLRALAP
ncbi:MAG TPA: HEAT repeat domain-containing protein [Vicinamibacterales bacterium]|nr:HEAT repeat domain-containing protein [Vicinamibacterales bacterium]